MGYLLARALLILPRLESGQSVIMWTQLVLILNGQDMFAWADVGLHRCMCMYSVLALRRLLLLVITKMIVA